jgi:predicted Holliday junction resolvase-like endonuclease
MSADFTMEIIMTIITAIVAPVLLLCIKTSSDIRKTRIAAEAQREHLHEWLETLQSEVNNLREKMDRLREMTEKQIERTDDEIEAAKVRSRVVIHDRLSQAHRYCMQQGYIERETARAIDAMYDVYHKECGGNGYTDKLIKDIRALPIKD